MNKECEIVKDLLPNYVANILSKETEKFVDEHVKGCRDCELILKNMKNNEIINNAGEYEQIEIDHLKKYRNKMNILKSIIIVIFLLIAIFVSIFIIKYKYNTNIMSKVSSSIETLKKEDNYLFKVVEHKIDYEREYEDTFGTLYFYKEGKYKIERNSKSSKQIILNANEYYYGEINSNEQTEISVELNTIYNKTSNYNYVKKGDFFNTLYDGINLFGENLGFFTNIILKSSYKLRNERYNGKECYVYKVQDDSGYTEYWIDKENMIPIRKVQDIYNKFYTEKNYFIDIGKVTENDVTMKNFDGYKIVNKEINMNNYFK